MDQNSNSAVIFEVGLSTARYKRLKLAVFSDGAAFIDHSAVLH